MMLFGFLVVPALIVYGYTVRVLRSAALGEEAAPRFGDWGGLLGDGLKVAGIAVAYVAVPYAVVFVALFGTLFAAGGNDGVRVVVVVLSVLIALAAFVSLFVAAYVLPVALTNFALEDRLGAAFEFRKIAAAAFTRDYVVAVLISIGVGSVVGLVFFFVFFIAGGIVQLVFVAVFTAMYGGVDPGLATGASLIVSILAFIAMFAFFAVTVFVGFYVQISTSYLLGRGSGETLLDGSSSVD